MDRKCGEAFWAAFCWARGLGLPGRAREANFIPTDLAKRPLVREWRHWSAAGLTSPRLTSYEVWRMERLSASDRAPAAYAILTGSAGLVVVDVDDPALLPALLRLYGDTPVRTRTPSGGVHLYYLAPEDPDAPGGRAEVTSRTAVRGPRSYDVKGSGGMAHMPGGSSHSGEYRAHEPLREWEAGELRALLPTFPSSAYEADWRAHHPEAEWEPQGERADDVELPPEAPEAEALWAEVVDLIGPAGQGERHDKARRLSLNLGDRGCPEERAVELLAEWNRTCAPPDDPAVVEARAREAYRTRRSALGCRIPEALLRAAGAAPDPAEPPEAEPDADPDGDAPGAEAPAVGPIDVPRDVAPHIAPIRGAGRRADGPVSARAVDFLREALTRAQAQGGRAALRGLLQEVADPAELAATCYDRGLSSVEAAAELEDYFGPRGASPSVLAAARLWVYSDARAAGGAEAAARVEVPREVFAGCPWFVEFAESVARPLNLHPDASLLTGLAMFAVGLRDAVDVVAENLDGDPWSMPGGIYAVVEVPSGGGKSALLRAWGERALQDYEGYLWRSPYARAVQEHRDERDRIEREWAAQVKPRAVRSPRPGASPAAHAASAHAQAVARGVAGLAAQRPSPSVLADPIPTVPSVLLDDVTPERFAQIARVSGYVALVTAEGAKTLQNFLRGREGREQTDVLLSAFSRDSYRRDRVGEARDPLAPKPVELRRSRFSATLLLMIQCGVLSPSSEDDGKMLGVIARRGLLARCLIGRPPQLSPDQIELGEAAMRADREDPARKARARARKRAMQGFLAHVLRELPAESPEQAARRAGAADSEPPHAIPGRQWPPHPLAPARRFRAVLTPAANEALQRFKSRMARRTAPGGDLAGEMIGELARRLPEHVARVAALLRYLRGAEPAWRGALEQAEADEDSELGDSAWCAPAPLPPVLCDADVDEEDVERARRLAEEYLLEQARLVYRRAIYAPSEDDADAVAEWLAAQPDGAATRAQIARAEPFARGWLERGRTGRSRLDSALGILVDRGQATKQREAGGDRYLLATRAPAEG